MPLALLALTIAACGDDGEATTGTAASSSAATGRWVFTDDRGETVALDEAPDRIVTLSLTTGPLWGLGVRPVGMLGSPTNADGSIDPIFGDVDPTLPSVGEYPEINLERLAALEPDLIIDNVFNGKLDAIEATSGQKEHVLEIAPVVAITTSDRSVPEVIDRFADVATALGAAVDGSDVDAARDDFDRAAERLRDAVATAPGLTMLIAWTPATELQVANPNVYPFGLLLQELGLDLVGVEGDDTFESVSWEQASSRSADIIAYFANPAFPEGYEGTDNPLWQALPAVEAGQLTTWDTSWHLATYDNYARILNELADVVEVADPGVATP